MPLRQFTRRQFKRRRFRTASWPRAAIVFSVAFALAWATFDLPTSRATAQGFLEQLFGGGVPDYQYRARPSAAPRRWARHRHRSEQPFFRRSDARTGARSAIREQDGDIVFESVAGNRSYCVRECDGYFFPVGVYSGASDSTSHQRTCSKLCPGAKTSLYVLRSGSDKVEDAVSARSGALYSKLVASLRKRDDQQCSCRSAETEPPAHAIYRDFTLRRGDAVMTTRGMEIFHGGGHYPYTTSDFRSLSETRDLPERTRRMLAALESASKHGRGAVSVKRAKLLDEHRSQSTGAGPRR